MRALFDTATILLVSGGVIFFLAGTAGLLRFPDQLTRLHALTKADNLGLGMIVIGLLPQAAGIFAGLKLVAVWLLAQLAAAAATRLVSRTLHPPS
jgi:multicomponent Na+:H+ antiporter subunit G